MKSLVDIPSFLTEGVENTLSLYATGSSDPDSDDTEEACPAYSSSCAYYNCSAFSSGGSGGCSTYSEPVLPDPPGTGTITVTETTKDSITVRFSSISGADGYIVSCTAKEGEGSWSYSFDSSGTHTFDGLEPETAYILSYYGYNDGGEGPTASVEAETKPLGGYVWIYHQGEWRIAYPYIFHQNNWIQHSANLFSSGNWQTTV